MNVNEIAKQMQTQQESAQNAFKAYAQLMVNQLPHYIESVALVAIDQETKEGLDEATVIQDVIFRWAGEKEWVGLAEVEERVATSADFKTCEAVYGFFFEYNNLPEGEYQWDRQ